LYTFTAKKAKQMTSVCGRVDRLPFLCEQTKRLDDVSALFAPSKAFGVLAGN